jgi:hypothetical protein
LYRTYQRGEAGLLAGLYEGGGEEGRGAQYWTQYQGKGGSCSVLTKEGRLFFFLRGVERGRGGGEAGIILDTISGKGWELYRTYQRGEAGLLFEGC